jgi:hypothetical protein
MSDSARGIEFEARSGAHDAAAARARMIATLRLLWNSRKLFFRAVVGGALLSAGLVLLIPVCYEATAQLMPPDGQAGGTGLAMLSALAGRSGGLGGVAGDLLGVRNSACLIVLMVHAKISERAGNLSRHPAAARLRRYRLRVRT